MKPIIEDIKQLESVRSFHLVLIIDYYFQQTGVPFNINGVQHHFHGTVTIISADNPASALLGGFKQSASAFRYCRQCLGMEEDIQSKV